ncbi:MAG: hypothetical protein LBV31_03170 [Prevotellaceae bacterium]|nr:hypothetical protein [Prevotellaceae bacterium]
MNSTDFCLKGRTYTSCFLSCLTGSGLVFLHYRRQRYRSPAVMKIRAFSPLEHPVDNHNIIK